MKTKGGEGAEGKKGRTEKGQGEEDYRKKMNGVERFAH